jgi:hypothetical protein
MKTLAITQQTDSDQHGSAGKPRDELVWGATAIGRLIGRNARQVYHMHAQGILPTRSVGGRLCGRASSLLAIAD